ncbi:Hypothetical Protein FCC1311_106982 [Hondaea fermentalgiana]|uniref:Uncharacterized protein n=1 Tax=Hondaea fermentalgiana TaxID=2315210 RepID=A0A2R5H264_9STRA|nr:Hypothetical Protein FCC1311_106982 [Hondaea fermentalgiana]|eukprot:GBG34474.1 Hypothetical Protein FCC1311_106982 [Hondaea fermentalgiana]
MPTMSAGQASSFLSAANFDAFANSEEVTPDMIAKVLMQIPEVTERERKRRASMQTETNGLVSSFAGSNASASLAHGNASSSSSSISNTNSSSSTNNNSIINNSNNSSSNNNNSNTIKRTNRSQHQTCTNDYSLQQAAKSQHTLWPTSEHRRLLQQQAPRELRCTPWRKMATMADLVDCLQEGGSELDQLKTQKLIDATGLLQEARQHALEPLTLYTRSELFELFASIAEVWKNSGKSAWKKRINKVKENARYRKAPRNGPTEKEAQEIAELTDRIKEREAWEASVKTKMSNKTSSKRTAVFHEVPEGVLHGESARKSRKR